jgi:RNA polymerase sigma-70 factor (ECF subfamily)
VSRREAEFERVALCHSQSLLRVAKRLSPYAWASEDLVQDCLLSAWRNFHQFEPGTNARAWLFRILFNCFHAEGRKRSRVSEIIPISAEIRVAAPGYDDRIRVSNALDSLTLDHRTVLVLAVVEGFTCGEIAGILGLPIGTVMSRLSRARLSMREKLTAVRPAMPGVKAR